MSDPLSDLVIPARPAHPAVQFSADTGVLFIEGESYPENSFAFYRPLVTWVKAYSAAGRRPVTLNFRLAYCNSSSGKSILEILDVLDRHAGAGAPVRVYWHYPAADVDTLETGEEFQADCGLKFTFVPY